MSSQTLIETRRSGNRVLKIHLDEFAESPREHDNLGIMACSHSKYRLGDVQIESQEQLDELLQDAVVRLPLFLYDHSGLSILTGPNPFDRDGWDTSRLGVMYTTREKIRECFGDDPPSDEKIVKCLEGELETYNQYLSGQVYRYELSEAKKCDLGDEHLEEIDSCAGFYDENEIYAETGSEDWEVEEA